MITNHHMNRIHPSQPSHRNFLIKKSPIVAALMRAYHAYSAFHPPADLVGVLGGDNCKRSKMVGMRKYRGSISGEGTRTREEHPTKPRVQRIVALRPK